MRKRRNTYRVVTAEPVEATSSTKSDPLVRPTGTPFSLGQLFLPGLEPETLGLRFRCFTDWAIRPPLSQFPCLINELLCKACFDSDVAECSIFTQAARVRFPTRPDVRFFLRLLPIYWNKLPSTLIAVESLEECRASLPGSLSLQGHKGHLSTDQNWEKQSQSYQWCYKYRQGLRNWSEVYWSENKFFRACLHF